MAATEYFLKNRLRVCSLTATLTVIGTTHGASVQASKTSKRRTFHQCQNGSCVCTRTCLESIGSGFYYFCPEFCSGLGAGFTSQAKLYAPNCFRQFLVQSTRFGASSGFPQRDFSSFSRFIFASVARICSLSLNSWFSSMGRVSCAKASMLKRCFLTQRSPSDSQGQDWSAECS